LDNAFSIGRRQGRKGPHEREGQEYSLTNLEGPKGNFMVTAFHSKQDVNYSGTEKKTVSEEVSGKEGRKLERR